MGVGCIVNISDISAAYIFSIEECSDWGETLDMGHGQQGLELWVTQWKHVAWRETLGMGNDQQGLELWVTQWRHVALKSVNLFCQ